MYFRAHAEGSLRVKGFSNWLKVRAIALPTRFIYRRGVERQNNLQFPAARSLARSLASDSPSN